MSSTTRSRRLACPRASVMKLFWRSMSRKLIQYVSSWPVIRPLPWMSSAPATRKRHHRAASGKLSQQRREARKNQRRSVAPSACLPMPYHPNVSGGSYQPSAAIGFNEVLGLQSSCRSDSAFIGESPRRDA